jgi:hypothetical protein
VTIVVRLTNPHRAYVMGWLRGGHKEGKLMW